MFMLGYEIAYVSIALAANWMDVGQEGWAWVIAFVLRVAVGLKAGLDLEKAYVRRWHAKQ